MNEINIEKTERVNPFFESYGTPHNTVPFHKIRTEDYEEAVREGIRLDDEESKKSINEPETPAV